MEFISDVKMEFPVKELARSPWSYAAPRSTLHLFVEELPALGAGCRGGGPAGDGVRRCEARF